MLLAYARVARITIDVLVDDDLELSERLSVVAGKKGEPVGKR